MTDAASTKDPRVPPSGSADEDGTRNVPVPDELRRVCARLSEEVRRLCPYCAGTELVTMTPVDLGSGMVHCDYRPDQPSRARCQAGRIPAVLHALLDGRRPSAADVSAARNQICPRTICWGCRGHQGCPSRQLRDFLRSWKPDPGGNLEALLRERLEPVIEGAVVEDLTDRLLHGTGIAIPAGLVDDAPGVSDPPRHGGADERRCRSVARPVEPRRQVEDDRAVQAQIDAGCRRPSSFSEALAAQSAAAPPRRQLAYVKEATPGASEPPAARTVDLPGSPRYSHEFSFGIAPGATVEDVLPQIERVLRDRMPSREPDAAAPVASATDLVRMVENCMAHEEPPNEEVVTAARRVRDELLGVDAALELCAPEGLRVADLLRSSGLARAERVRKAVEWMYEFRTAFAAKLANATGLSRALREVQAALDINAKTQPHEVVAAVHALRQKLSREQGQHSEARRTLEDRRAEIRGALAELKAAPGTGLVDACRGRMRELASARADQVMREIDASTSSSQSKRLESKQRLVNERASNEVPAIETTVESFIPEPVFVLLGDLLVRVDSIESVDTWPEGCTLRLLHADGRREHRSIVASPAAVHAAIEGAKRDARPPLVVRGAPSQSRDAIRADADASGLRVVFLPRMAELVNPGDVPGPGRPS